MSNVPTGTLAFSIRVMIFPRRSAMGTPRRRIPTNPKPSTPPFFSTISYAKRTRVRSISDADISCAFWRRPVLRERVLAFIVELPRKLRFVDLGPVLHGHTCHGNAASHCIQTQRRRSSGQAQVFGNESDVSVFAGQYVFGRSVDAAGGILHFHNSRQNSVVVPQGLQGNGVGSRKGALPRQNSYTLIASCGFGPVERGVGELDGLFRANGLVSGATPGEGSPAHGTSFPHSNPVPEIERLRRHYFQNSFAECRRTRRIRGAGHDQE